MTLNFVQDHLLAFEGPTWHKCLSNSTDGWLLSSELFGYLSIIPNKDIGSFHHCRCHYSVWLLEHGKSDTFPSPSDDENLFVDVRNGRKEIKLLLFVWNILHLEENSELCDVEGCCTYVVLLTEHCLRSIIYNIQF